MNNHSPSSKITIRPLTTPTDPPESPETELMTQIVTPRRSERESRKRPPRQPNPLIPPFLYLLRLSILGVGLSALAGTVLTVFDPTVLTSYLSSKLNLSELLPTSKPNLTKPEAPKTKTSKPAPVQKPNTEVVSLTEEIAPLKKKLQNLIVKSPKLDTGLFFVDLDNGNYVDIKGETIFPAASTIKVPVLVALLQDVDAEKVRLDEEIEITKDVIASGSGDLQYQQDNKKLTVLQTAIKMISISDNTATNMLIKRLGGKEVLNPRFAQWGLKSTVIRNPLPDLEGTNTTSPKDLSDLLIRVNQGELLSVRSRDRLFNIMQQTKTRTLLPPGLEPDATIAHKTGDIGKTLGDTGIIDMTTGKRYVGTVMVNRPYNDPSARVLIQDISRTVYQHLKAYEKPPETVKPKAQVP